MLFCSTDRENCCIDELNIPGSWFLPNGTKMSTTSLHIVLGNQTVGLNISPELPSGIYHCEMMDRHNITHHLYTGIYPDNGGISMAIIRASYVVQDSKTCALCFIILIQEIFLTYWLNIIYQTIVCTSIGGPATDVTWYKDNTQIMISSEGGTKSYNYYSQIEDC